MAVGKYITRSVQAAYLRVGYMVKLGGVVRRVATVKHDDTHTHITVDGSKRLGRLPNGKSVRVGVPLDMLCNEHDWFTQPCGLIDTCSTCGEERA